MSKVKLANNTIGNAGEHFVAAELERRNFTTSVVGNNCKDYDIIAVNNETHKDVLIQVKATTKNQKRWLVNRNTLIEDNLFYVLVSLCGKQPIYYILSSKDAVNIKEKNHKEYCKRNGYDINDKKIKMREIILEDDKYKDNWDILDYKKE